MSRSVTRGLLLATLFLLPIGTVLILSESHAVIGGARNVFAVPKLYVVEILAALSGLAWWWSTRPAWRDLGTARWLLPVVGYAALSTLWAPRPLLAGLFAVHLAIGWLWLVALSHEYRDPEFARDAARVFLAGVALQAVWAITQYAVQHDLGLQRLGESVLGTSIVGVAKISESGHKLIRAYGSLPHPNILAAYLSAGLFLAGALVFWPRTAKSRLYLAISALLVLLGAGLLLTFSRTALLVTAVNGVLVMIFAVRQWRRLPLAAAAAAGAVIVIGLILSKPLMSRTQLNSAQETGVTNRTLGYDAALKMIGSKPYGVGAGNFVTTFDRYKPGLPAYQQQPAHDVPLLIAAELGIIPALLVLWFVINLGWRFHRLRPSNRRANTLNFSIFMLGGVFIALGLVDHFWWTSVPGLLLLTTYAAIVRSRLPVSQA